MWETHRNTESNAVNIHYFYLPKIFHSINDFRYIMVHKTIKNTERIIDALTQVGNFISSITDLHHLLELIMEESKKVADAEASSLMLYEEQYNDLYFEVALGEKGYVVKKFRLQLGDGIAGTAAKERRLINVKDVRSDARHFKAIDEKSKFKTKSILAVPLISKNKLIGVLEVLNKKGGGAFTEEDEKVIKIFSDQAAIAIENAQLIIANIHSERLAAMGQAIAGISHYVKNILTGMQGSSSIIEQGLSIDDFEIIKQAWPILKRSNQKITSLIQDMLTYSKERKPELSVGNINNLIEEIINLYLQRANDKGITLNARISEKIPILLFDGSRVNDALLNIVGNAIEAINNESGVVTITSELNEDAKKVIITISDNGSGMSAEVQAKIFEPFFSTKGSKGTGLGLAIAKKGIEEHNGTLSVESEPGKGTTFTITLPVIEP